MFVPIVRSLRLKRIYHALFGQRLFEGASAIIATSEQEVEELARGGWRGRKSCCAGMEWKRLLRGQSGELFARRWELPNEAKIILFLGRLSEKKSPDLLLKAFASLLKEGGGNNSAARVCRARRRRNEGAARRRWRRNLGWPRKCNSPERFSARRSGRRIAMPMYSCCRRRMKTLGIPRQKRWRRARRWS